MLMFPESGDKIMFVSLTTGFPCRTEATAEAVADRLVLAVLNYSQLTGISEAFSALSLHVT